MVKKKNPKTKKTKSNKKKLKKKSVFFVVFLILLAIILSFAIFASVFINHFDRLHKGKIYSGVKIDNVNFGGKTKEDIVTYYEEKSQPLKNIELTLSFEDKIATLSAEQMNIAYDGNLSSTQAFAIGRSGHLLSDLYQKWLAATIGIKLTSMLNINYGYIDETLNSLSLSINIEPENALFQFENGKVTAFKLAKPGRKLDIEKTQEMIYSTIEDYVDGKKDPQETVTIKLPVHEIEAEIKTEESNDLGIKELIGIGTSKFTGSIAGRIHNLQLATSRIDGNLVKPGETFSFNEALGDVSAATGYKTAYIIKDGRTVLGDGGGVCQVSTTLFRAALSSGLPIIERHPHSYRVSYYEQGSEPGIDATVFSPSYDLKFKNDTDNYMLIHGVVNPKNYTMKFEIYGKSDGRKVEMTKPVILSQTPPPPDLYQDDPTLKKGVVKQVDWKAWGAKVSFDYKVTKENNVIFQKTFYSNFQPWQAVFLRGTME